MLRGQSRSLALRLARPALRDQIPLPLFQTRWLHRRRPGDLYTDLTLEIGIQPSELKLMSLLKETADLKSASKVGAVVADIVVPRGHDPLLKILQEIPATDREGYSPIIYTTTLVTAIKKGRSIIDVHDSLVKVLGMPSRESMLHVLGNAAMSVDLPDLKKYFDAIPSYYLDELCDTQIPLWLEAGARKQNLNFVLQAAAGRLLFPKTPKGLNAAIVVLNDFPAYLHAVTKALRSLSAHRRVPHMSEGFCVMVARNFANSTSFASSGPTIDKEAIAAFIDAVERTRPAVGRSAVLGERFWRTIFKAGFQPPLAKLRPDTRRLAQRAALPTLVGACRVEIAELVSKIERGQDVSENAALFVARYARILRLVSGDRTPPMLASAQRHGDKVLGTRNEANRNRRWLTAALENCVRRKRYAAALELIHGVRQTRTPFLWSLAVSALAGSHRSSEGWQWVADMREHNLAFNKNAAVALLKSSLQEDRVSFKQNLETLADCGVVLDDSDMAAVFHYAGTGACPYTWKDLGLLARDAAQVSQRRVQAIRRDLSLDGSTNDLTCQPGSMIGSQCLREIVWWAFLKMPHAPWQAVRFLLSLQEYGVSVEAGAVRASVAHAFQKLGRPTGEARRVVLQAGHTLAYVSEQFNSEWDKLAPENVHK